MDGLAIGQVACRAGVSASTIRYYEKAGLLAEPERVGGKRRYDPGVIQRLGLIEAAKRTGLTIKETYTLLYGFQVETTASERWQSLASSKLEEVDKLMAQLEEMRALLSYALRCECASLDECSRLLAESK